MKPLRLVMQAFGPYATTSEIDFRELTRGGLFLIHGQTGAGKTSILDGICFALFGKSSGADRSGEGLRSDLASDALPTEVIFEFALGADEYRVVRRPRQMLRRVRGDGLAQQLPKGELSQLKSGDWLPLTSGDKKTDERIGQLVGMTEEQFRQVVVLPQGQFRRFLAASSDAREKLLETLFRTEKYRRLSEHLGSKATVVQDEIGLQKQALDAQLAHLEIGAPAELDERLREALRQVDALESSAHDLETRLTAANERLRAAERFVQVDAEFTALERREKRLNESAESIRHVTEKLERDRRSRPVLAILASIEQHERDLSRLRAARTREEKRRDQAESELQITGARRETLETRAPAIEELKSEQQSLREIYAAAKKLRSEQDGLAALDAQVQAAAVQLRELQVHRDANLLSRLANAEAMRRQEGRAARLESARAESRLRQNEIDLVSGEVRELEQAAFQLERAEAFRRETRTALEVEEASLKKLRIGFHLSQAALLSAELSPGEPCPVCGSSDHPQPANAALDQIYDPEMISAAELARDRAASRDASARDRALVAAEQKDQAQVRLDRRFPGSADHGVAASRAAIDAAARALKDLHDVIGDAEAAVAERRETQIKLAAVETEMARIEADLRTAAARQEEARLRFETAKARAATLEMQVPADKRDLDAITRRGQELKVETETFAKDLAAAVARHQDSVQAATAARANIETLTIELSEKTRELDAQSRECVLLLAASGFADLDECRAAGLQGGEARALEETRRAYDDERAVVLSRLGELRVESERLPDWARDFDARTAEQRAAEIARRESHGQLLALRERVVALESARGRVAQLGAVITALEEKYKVIGRLAQVAAGQPPHNLSRVNFARFVLASRLDEVLDLASRRLYGMSRGQFTLRRALTGTDKRKNSGLDLEVEDAHSGSTRPTSSLSGGEGFMASLALALGLADVVQNELGGVRLDAVFVDEGFGTLDSEALELAMKTLAELQAGGRIVGVISHVPELKEQIARRLYVRKTPLGSHVGWESSPSP